MIKVRLKDTTVKGGAGFYYVAICDKCNKQIAGEFGRAKLVSMLRQDGYSIKKDNILCKECNEI